jgi:hypothetical protein
MPVCIYCLKTKTEVEFSDEHVLTRAFCGQGQNWTLKDMVCTQCNGALSVFESHWTQSAVESVMRNFSGPLGRSKKGRGRRQPTEINHLYLVQAEDPLAYEAGFAFPNDFYVRPQVLQTEEGLLSVATNEQEGLALQEAMQKSLSARIINIVEPNDSKPHRTYSVTRLELNEKARAYTVLDTRVTEEPSGIWFRRYPDPPTVCDFAGLERLLTPRLALDDRGRLYFRAARTPDAAKFLSLLHQRKAAPAKPARAVAPEDQTLRLGIITRLPHVFRAVLKTGLNLIADSFGPDVAMDSAFSELRDILFDDNKDDAVMRRCKFLGRSWSLFNLGRSAFPPPADSRQHRLMLDFHRGQLRVRLRFYGSLGYEGVLAPATTQLRAAVSTKRFVVDYETTGIRPLSDWS